MWKTAKKLVQTLTAAGHTAYFAGGAVRDLLLDRKVADIDIATSARPEEVQKLFPRTRLVGAEFGVVIVIAGKHAFEIATFRGEAAYDGRRPGQVFFTDAAADALRRDFTVNGLFYDPVTRRVLDFVNGQHDLKLKVLRAIGEPDTRFAEDHLRLLRAVRFANTIGLAYEPKTAKAIAAHASLLARISAERVRDEFSKMLAEPSRAHAVRDLAQFGLLATVLPELLNLQNVAQPPRWHAEGDAFTHSLGALAALPQKVALPVALAALLHDLGKTATKTISETGEITFPDHAAVSAELASRAIARLKFDRATRAEVTWLIGNHMLLGDLPRMRPAHRYRYFTQPWFPHLLQVFLADIRGTRPAEYDLYLQVSKMYRAMRNTKQLAPAVPLLSGHEIGAILQIQPGKEIGKWKEKLWIEQVEGRVTTRAAAEEWLRRAATLK